MLITLIDKYLHAHNDCDGETFVMIINGLFAQEKYEIEKRKRQRMSETLYRARDRALRQQAKLRSC